MMTSGILIMVQITLSCMNWIIYAWFCRNRVGIFFDYLYLYDIDFEYHFKEYTSFISLFKKKSDILSWQTGELP